MAHSLHPLCTPLSRYVAVVCTSLATMLVALAPDAGAAPSRHHVRKARQLDVRATSRTPDRRSAANVAAEPVSRPPPDDLYRRRGYGTGGLVFGLGQGGTAQAGACADLAFARPGDCGPAGGYGIYGNGLGYGFGF